MGEREWGVKRDRQTKEREKERESAHKGGENGREERQPMNGRIAFTGRSCLVILPIPYSNFSYARLVYHTLYYSILFYGIFHFYITSQPAKTKTSWIILK